MTDPRVRPEFAAPQHVKLARNLTSKFPDVPPADKVRPLTSGSRWPQGQKRRLACICVCFARYSFFRLVGTWSAFLMFNSVTNAYFL